MTFFPLYLLFFLIHEAAWLPSSHRFPRAGVAGAWLPCTRASGALWAQPPGREAEALRWQRKGMGTCVPTGVSQVWGGSTCGCKEGGTGLHARLSFLKEVLQRRLGMLCSVSGDKEVVMRVTMAQLTGMGMLCDPTLRLLPIPGTCWPRHGLLSPALEKRGFAMPRSSQPLLQPWAT